MNPTWVEEARTMMQAQLDGQPTGNWPPPCSVCGALWQRTPAGRWYIDHFGDRHRKPTETRHEEPRRASAEPEGVLSIMDRIAP